jgi:DNA-directed RNA polymerase I, II, and III subunit RPABC2
MPPRKIKKDEIVDIKVDSDDVEKNIKKKIIIKKNISVLEPIIKIEDVNEDENEDVNEDKKDKIENVIENVIEDDVKDDIKNKLSSKIKKIDKSSMKTVKEKSTDKETEKDHKHSNIKHDIDNTPELPEILVDTNRKQIKSSHNHSKPKKLTASKGTDSSFDMFGDDDIDFRYIMMNYDYTKNKTMAKITKYEKALIIGKRAKQIEEGANANIKVLPGQNAIEIAEEELRQRKIPLIIKRPNGNTFEYWKPADMEINMD